MHLSVALDGAGWHPAAWREPRARPDELFTARYWVDLITEAERGLLDFVTIEDGFSVQSSRADQVHGRLDAVLIAARAAPLTRHIGLMPAVIVTHTEPFDRGKLHYIDFTGPYFSVKGPSITPRPPQGQPVVSALGHGAVPYQLIATAADIGFVTPREAGHARAIVAQIRAAADAVGRAQEPNRVFADLVVFLGTSVEEAADRKARMDELLAEEWHRR